MTDASDISPDQNSPEKNGEPATGRGPPMPKVTMEDALEGFGDLRRSLNNHWQVQDR